MGRDAGGVGELLAPDLFVIRVSQFFADGASGANGSSNTMVTVLARFLRFQYGYDGETTVYSRRQFDNGCLSSMAPDLAESRSDE